MGKVVIHLPPDRNQFSIGMADDFCDFSTVSRHRVKQAVTFLQFHAFPFAVQNHGCIVLL